MKNCLILLLDLISFKTYPSLTPSFIRFLIICICFLILFNEFFMTKKAGAIVQTSLFYISVWADILVHILCLFLHLHLQMTTRNNHTLSKNFIVKILEFFPITLLSFNQKKVSTKVDYHFNFSSVGFGFGYVSVSVDH